MPEDQSRRVDFSFDQRIASHYDEQRAHVPAASRAIGRSIAGLAVPGRRVLELGVGTGRIALPTVAAGAEVLGVDISREMLEVARSAGSPGLLLVQADIQALPIRSRSADAALAVHVLHLVADWRRTLAGAARCLRPGGAFLLGRDWTDPESMMGRLRQQFRALSMAHAASLRPPVSLRSLLDCLVELAGGPDRASTEEVVAAEWVAPLSPAAAIDSIARRTDAESWVLPDPVLAEVVAGLTDWARATFPDPDSTHQVRQRFLLSVVRGDWAAAA